VAGEGGQALTDHRLAQNVPVLLGQFSADALPAAGCHDHRCNSGCHVRDPKG
jgi:hypothetical protein